MLFKLGFGNFAKEIGDLFIGYSSSSLFFQSDEVTAGLNEVISAL